MHYDFWVLYINGVHVSMNVLLLFVFGSPFSAHMFCLILVYFVYLFVFVKSFFFFGCLFVS